MEAIFTTVTDKQRVDTLNSIYQKGLCTPKEALAFSSDKLVYVKPFISKLQNENGATEDLSSRIMARQVIDELLNDIMDEIEMSCARSAKDASKIALEYGLHAFINNDEDFYFANKVA